MNKIFIISLCLLLSSNSFAARIGSFAKQCYAPNWQSGQIEVVPEINVYGRSHDPVFAFTKRMPGGRWRIEWNYDRIRQFQLSNDVIIFLFYHECAHAKFNSASEAVADCEGLRDMDRDGYLSRQTYATISAIYQSFGRRFPSGRCL